MGALSSSVGAATGMGDMTSIAATAITKELAKYPALAQIGAVAADLSKFPELLKTVQSDIITKVTTLIQTEVAKATGMPPPTPKEPVEGPGGESPEGEGPGGESPEGEGPGGESPEGEGPGGNEGSTNNGAASNEGSGNNGAASNEGSGNNGAASNEGSGNQEGGTRRRRRYKSKSLRKKRRR